MLKRLSSCFRCNTATDAYDAKDEEGGSILEGRRFACKAAEEEVKILTFGKLSQYDLSPTGVIVIANSTHANGTDTSLPKGGLMAAAGTRFPVYINASAVRMLRLGSSSLLQDDVGRLDNTAALLAALAHAEPAFADKLDGLLYALSAGHQGNGGQNICPNMLKPFLCRAVPATDGESSEGQSGDCCWLRVTDLEPAWYEVSSAGSSIALLEGLPDGSNRCGSSTVGLTRPGLERSSACNRSRSRLWRASNCRDGLDTATQIYRMTSCSSALSGGDGVCHLPAVVVKFEICGPEEVKGPENNGGISATGKVLAAPNFISSTKGRSVAADASLTVSAMAAARSPGPAAERANKHDDMTIPPSNLSTPMVGPARIHMMMDLGTVPMTLFGGDDATINLSYQQQDKQPKGAAAEAAARTATNRKSPKAFSDGGSWATQGTLTTSAAAGAGAGAAVEQRAGRDALVKVHHLSGAAAAVTSPAPPEGVVQQQQQQQQQQQTPAGAREVADNNCLPRLNMVLSSLEPIVTAFSTNGNTVFYQNAASIAYFGPRPSQTSSFSPSLLHGPGPAANGISDGLAQLFALEPAKLERMMTELYMDGRIWKGIIQVPVSCAPGAPSSSPHHSSTTTSSPAMATPSQTMTIGANNSIVWSKSAVAAAGGHLISMDSRPTRHDPCFMGHHSGQQAPSTTATDAAAGGSLIPAPLVESIASPHGMIGPSTNHASERLSSMLFNTMTSIMDDPSIRGLGPEAADMNPLATSTWGLLLENAQQPPPQNRDSKTSAQYASPLQLQQRSIPQEHTPGAEEPMPKAEGCCSSGNSTLRLASRSSHLGGDPKVLPRSSLVMTKEEASCIIASATALRQPLLPNQQQERNHCSQQPQLDTGLGTKRSQSSIDDGNRTRGLSKPMTLTSPGSPRKIKITPISDNNDDDPVEDIMGTRRDGTSIVPRAASMHSIPGLFSMGAASREMSFCSSYSSRAVDQQGLTNISRGAPRYSRVFTFASSLRNTPAVLQQAAASGSMCSASSIAAPTQSGRASMAVVSNNHGHVPRVSLTHMCGTAAVGSTSAGDPNVAMDGVITAAASGVLDSAGHQHHHHHPTHQSTQLLQHRGQAVDTPFNITHNNQRPELSFGGAMTTAATTIAADRPGGKQGRVVWSGSTARTTSLTALPPAATAAIVPSNDDISMRQRIRAARSWCLRRGQIHKDYKDLLLATATAGRGVSFRNGHSVPPDREPVSRPQQQVVQKHRPAADDYDRRFVTMNSSTITASTAGGIPAAQQSIGGDLGSQEDITGMALYSCSYNNAVSCLNPASSNTIRGCDIITEKSDHDNSSLVPLYGFKPSVNPSAECTNTHPTSAGHHPCWQQHQHQQQQQEGTCCWHEVTATRAVDPLSGAWVIVVTQTDVTTKILAESHLAFVAEAEHRLLEQIFPRHVLAYMAEEGGILGPPAPSLPIRPSPNSPKPPALSWNVGKLATLHPEVTLLFADIQGFTPMCQVLEPQVVMSFLNDLFTRFDRQLEEYEVYKVETIGDCYFVAGGLIESDEYGMPAVRARESRRDPLHAEKVFMFAKAMLALASEVSLPTTGGPVRMRIGIHSGPVVSGVVGERMPRFCLFGDTVNTTSRMESTGVPGCIHASEAAMRQLSNEAWVPTGGIEVKGKGLMSTYLWIPPGRHECAEVQELVGPLRRAGKTKGDIGRTGNTSTGTTRPAGSEHTLCGPAAAAASTTTTAASSRRSKERVAAVIEGAALNGGDGGGSGSHEPVDSAGGFGHVSYANVLVSGSDSQRSEAKDSVHGLALLLLGDKAG